MQKGHAEKNERARSPIHRSSALRRALSWPVAKRSLVIMVVVGSVLNFINQGDALWSGGIINWWKLLLTFCVPFCVATYGAYCAYCVAEMR